MYTLSLEKILQNLLRYCIDLINYMKKMLRISRRKTIKNCAIFFCKKYVLTCVKITEDFSQIFLRVSNFDEFNCG